MGLFCAFVPKNAPQMNQIEVIHASQTYRDPPDMLLLDVCMADVRETVVFEMELEGIKTERAKVSGAHPMQN